jgi:PASTA domain
VVGRSLDEAKGSIAAADLTTGPVTEEPSQVSALGTVLRQEPPPGAIATKGTAVALVVAAAPAPLPALSVEAKDRDKSKPADPGFPDPGVLGTLGLAVAFEVKELGLHATFIGQDSAATALFFGAAGPGGLVIRLDPGTAQKAGLHVGDVITKIGPTPIRRERPSNRPADPGTRPPPFHGETG